MRPFVPADPDPVDEQASFVPAGCQQRASVFVTRGPAQAGLVGFGVVGVEVAGTDAEEAGNVGILGPGDEVQGLVVALIAQGPVSVRPGRRFRWWWSRRRE